MKKKVSGIMFTLLLISVFVLAFNIQPVKSNNQPSAVASTPQLGPRVSDLRIDFYGDSWTLYFALKVGDIDISFQPLTRLQYEDAVTDPNILLAPVTELGKYQFDLNNNYTISSTETIDALYAKIRNPLSLKEFRQALAHMVNKNYIVDDICEGLAERNDVPVSPSSGNWRNTTVIGDNYPYPYSLALANSKLDAIGFIDRNSDGIRNYPVSWPGLVEAGYDANNPPNVHPFIFYARDDHDDRLNASRYLRNNMTTCGLPVDWRSGLSTYCFPPVLERSEFHIYSGGWRLQRHPTYLYWLYHDAGYYSNGPNYVTGKNELGEPNYPLLNQYLEQLYYAGTFEEAKAMAKKAQGIIVDESITIELWSDVNFYAYSNYLVGLVNMDGYGPVNIYTYMNAYKVDNPATPVDESQQPIRIGTTDIVAPYQINQIYSHWGEELAVLNGFMDESLYPQPYNIDSSESNPWRAKDWLVDTWVDPADGEEKTQVTWWYKPDVQWIEPVTGQPLKPFTSEDVEFSIWYYYQTTDAWDHWLCEDIHSVIIHNDHEVTLRFDSKSIFGLWHGRISSLERSSSLRLLPKAGGWLLDPLTSEETATVAVNEDHTLSLPYQVVGAPVELMSISPGNGNITKGRIVSDRPPGTSVTVTYRARGDARWGDFPGGLPWQETLIGTGPYYLASLQVGVGGYAYFRANRNYFLETPALGELDWTYKWIGTAPETPDDPPRTGCWKTDIYDVTYASGAYGSSGRYVPDEHWKPSADIDACDLGHVGIYDIVTVMGKYAREPLNPPVQPPPIPDKPIVYVDPSEISASVSSTFTVSVKISNVENLYGFDLQFRWNPTLLEYVSHSIRIPKDDYSDGILWGPTWRVRNEIDVEAGTYWIAYSSFHPAPPFSGEGTVFTMTFQVKAECTSDLRFDSTDLGDKEGKPISHYGEGALVYSGAPTPDFSVTASSISLSIQQGGSDISTITITSIGGFNQPVQLTVSGAPSGVTATLSPEQVTPPPDGSTTSTLTVSVDTTATTGSYTLTVTGTNGTLTHSTYITLEVTAVSPLEVWVEVYGTGSNLAIRKTAGIGGDVLKRVPDKWVLKVIDQHGDSIVKDGDTWWEVKDVTDGVEGWSASEHLRYDESKQEEWKEKTKEVISVYYDLPGKDFRFQEQLELGDEGKEVAYLHVLLKEESCFSYAASGLGEYTTDATGYFGDVTKNAVMSFQKKHNLEESGQLDKNTVDKLNALLDEKYAALISEKYSRKSRTSVVLEKITEHYVHFLPDNFPIGLILSVVVGESGIICFNNEIVALTPWGRGIMQIDSDYHVGRGCDITWYKDGKVDYCRREGCTCGGCTRSGSYCYCEVCKHYYTNTIQGIEANIKDGLCALKQKHEVSCHCCYDASESAVLTEEGLYKDDLGNGVIIYSKLEKCIGRHGIEYDNRIERVEIDGIEISCSELRIMFAVWAYNSLSVYNPREDIPCTKSDYLRCVANNLDEIKGIFGYEMHGKDKWVNSLKAVADKAKEMVEIKSWGYLQVLDPEGRITGIVNGEIREELPFSFYDEESSTIVIPFSYNSYYYQVVGMEEGTYGLKITFAEYGNTTTFNATQIPTSTNATHQYTINWNVLSLGEEGVTVQVDSDGDGVFEHTFTSDSELTQSEFLSQVAPPLSVSINPLSASILVDQSVTFTSTVSGGYTPYSYQWYLNGNPVSGATSTSWTLTPTTSGIYYVYLKVTDDTGNSTQSETTHITVTAIPVGGYSFQIKGYTTTKPFTICLALVVILAVGFTMIKRKTHRRTKQP